MDKKGGRQLERYTKKLDGAIDGLTPWNKNKRWDDLVRRKKLQERGVVDPELRKRQVASKAQSAALWTALQSGKPIEPHDGAGVEDSGKG